METNIIHCGNHLDILKEYPDGCFDMFLTSPPYDDLRDYKGYTFKFEPLVHELYRIGNNHTKYGNAFEYMFIFSKGKPKTFHPLKDKPNTQAGKRIKKTKRLPNGEVVEDNCNIKQKYYDDYGHRNNIWTYSTGYMLTTTDKEAFEHPAQFPEKLAEDHILSWSNPGDIVLDPMCGSGTTCKMAVKHQRRYIGIDCAEKYCEIARKRIDTFTRQTTIFDALPLERESS